MKRNDNAKSTFFHFPLQILRQQSNSIYTAYKPKIQK